VRNYRVLYSRAVYSLRYPKIAFLLLILFVARFGLSLTPESSPPAAPQEQAQISILSNQLLQDATVVDCRKDHCSILVTNFAFAEGYTSPLGIRLADELSAELAQQTKSITVVDRALIRGPQEDLIENRVPGPIRYSVPVLRSLGAQTHASVVVVGQLERSSDRIKLIAHLCNVKNAKSAGRSFELALPTPQPAELSPSDLLPPLDPLPQTANSPRIFRNADRSIIPPKCTSMPNPSYTDQARKFKISGTIRMDTIIAADGTVKPLRVAEGLPFEMNESAMRTIATWKCNPGTANGEPIPLYVPIEVTFRLY